MLNQDPQLKLTDSNPDFFKFFRDVSAAKYGSMSKPVLRIHNILVWIWVRGSMPPTNGSGFGSCYFRHWSSTRQQKTNFSKKSFSAYYFLKVHLPHFSKLKSQRSHKTVGIKVFLTIFA
jgi:hypothetical protein